MEWYAATRVLFLVGTDDALPALRAMLVPDVQTVTASSTYQ